MSLNITSLLAEWITQLCRILPNTFTVLHSTTRKTTTSHALHQPRNSKLTVSYHFSIYCNSVGAI